MDPQFWHNAWAKTDTPGWQQKTANSLLQAHWRSSDSRVFVPLCGRSPDLEWLHRQGHFVTGIDLSESAVIQYFEERSIVYTETKTDTFNVFSADRYLLYVGDFFALTGNELNGIRDVYDRAAMIAMSADLRSQYMQHLQSIVPDEADLFVILLEYDQSLMKGPPFSVPETELRQFFDARYDIDNAGQVDTDFKHRGVDCAVEKAYRLTCKKA